LTPATANAKDGPTIGTAAPLLLRGRGRRCSDLRDRIAAAIYAELRRQFDGDSIDAPLVTPMIGMDEFSGVAFIDGEVNLIAAADAVIAELGLRIDTTPPRPLGHHRHVTDGEADDRQ